MKILLCPDERGNDLWTQKSETIQDTIFISLKNKQILPKQMNHMTQTTKLPPPTLHLFHPFFPKKNFQKEWNLNGTIKRLSNWDIYHKSLSNQTHLIVLSIFRNYFQQNL